MLEVLREGSAYVLENVFTGKQIQRAAAQVKQYSGEGEWLLEPASRVFDPDPEKDALPPRTRRPPRRWIEEC